MAEQNEVRGLIEAARQLASLRGALERAEALPGARRSAACARAQEASAAILRQYPALHSLPLEVERRASAPLGSETLLRFADADAAAQEEWSIAARSIRSTFRRPPRR